MLLVGAIGSVWGETESITYEFTSGNWAATVNGEDANWTLGKSANWFNNAVQITTTNSGAYATSPVSFNNISKIEVKYFQNSKSGAGTIALSVGVGNAHNISLSKPSSGGATVKTAEVTLEPAETGKVKILVTCTSNSIYIKEITIFYEAGGSTTPTISANDIDIAYDATSGSIAYTISNPTSESLSASTTSDWLTLGTVNTSSVPFSCTTNPTKETRTATITLTYGTVTKDVTVTQAANPNAIDNISDITSTGTYTVRGTIVAKSQRGFIVGDGTGYIYYYNQNYTQTDYNIGDYVQLSGSVVAYGGVFEYDSSATITAATESNYEEEDPTILNGSQMDSRVGSTTPTQLSTYVQYEGVLSVSGTHYNITNIEGATIAKGSISYPLNTDFTSLNEKVVKVTGYYVGISSSLYYNTLIGSVEEVVSTTPIINIISNEMELTYDAISGAIEYAIVNPAVGVNLSATSTADWISNITVGTDVVTFTTTANDGTADRTATITLAYNGAESKTVTVTQKHFVADYATLPFEFNGGKADIETTAGLSQSGLGSDYSSAPKLKFDGTDDELVLKFNEQPGILTFDIKNNSFSGGTFKVQTSADGITYTDLKTYTEISGTQNESFSNLGADVRYIKWVYTEKTSGNVGLGNITLAVKSGEEPSGDKYELFSGKLVEGDYIIYYDGKAMNTTVTSDRLQYAEITPTNNVITTDDSAIVWHIAPSGDYWTIYNAEANAYAASTGAKNKAQMLADGTDDKALWTVSGTETYEFVNKKNTANNVNANLRNNGTYGFACYADGTGGALSLYKKPITVTVGDALYTTFVAPAAVSFPEGVTAYIVTAINEGSVHMDEVSAVPTNTPIVVKATAADTYTLTKAESAQAVTGNLLRASDGNITGNGSTIYALGNKKSAGVGFYPVKNGAKVPKGKAYLEVNNDNIKEFFSFDFGGLVTEINNVNTDFDANAEIYNLAGQRVQKVQKGFYIVGGKKVLVK